MGVGCLNLEVGVWYYRLFLFCIEERGKREAWMDE